MNELARDKQKNLNPIMTKMFAENLSFFRKMKNGFSAANAVDLDGQRETAKLYGGDGQGNFTAPKDAHVHKMEQLFGLELAQKRPKAQGAGADQ